ncbi:MAG: YihY family inner membrane protein [bacterium]|nr:YihY family inner membrane protein [bacterium]
MSTSTRDGNHQGRAGRREKVIAGLHKAVTGAMGFFTYEIWRVRTKEYPRYKSWLIALVRVLVLSFRGFQKDKCQHRASALTYYTLLSIVPVLALAFGIAKGFGLEERLQAELQKFEAQREVIERAVEFAQNLLSQTSGGFIAGVGVLFLLWTIIKLLANVEESLNEIWGVKQGRTMTRKFTDYISVMFLCPLLLILSSSLNVMLNNQVDFLTSRIAALGPVAPYIRSVLNWTRYVVTWLVFAFVYLFLPNTRVKLSAGLIGGVVAGTIFVLVQWVYVAFQVGVARYNAIYGGFAALPLFLIWLNTSWVIVLYGAELTFACHNVSTYEYEPESMNVSHGLRKLLVLRIVHLLATRFVRGERALTAVEIAGELELPMRLVRQLLHELVGCGVLAEVVLPGRETRGYQPGRDVGQLTVVGVIEALEQHGFGEIPLGQTRELQELARTLDEFGAMLKAAPQNRPLVELV